MVFEDVSPFLFSFCLALRCFKSNGTWNEIDIFAILSLDAGRAGSGSRRRLPPAPERARQAQGLGAQASRATTRKAFGGSKSIAILFSWLPSRTESL